MKYVLAVLSFSGLLMVAGCNTAEGVGEDMEAAGDAIENEAED